MNKLSFSEKAYEFLTGILFGITIGILLYDKYNQKEVVYTPKLRYDEIIPAPGPRQYKMGDEEPMQPIPLYRRNK